MSPYCLTLNLECLEPKDSKPKQLKVLHLVFSKIICTCIILRCIYRGVGGHKIWFLVLPRWARVIKSAIDPGEHPKKLSKGKMPLLDD